MLRNRWGKIALAVLSGALTAFAMPGVGGGLLVLIALIPLYIALESGGFLVGLFYGITLFAIDLRWTLTLDRFSPLIYAGFVLIVLYMAVPFGVLGGVAAWHRRRSGSLSIVLVTSLFVLVEFLRAQGAMGMGFTTLYLSLHRTPWLIQSAAWFGPWFISGAIALANGLLYIAWRRRRSAAFAGAVAVIGLLAGASLVPIGETDEMTIDVAVVCSSVDQQVKLDAHNLPDLTERYLALLDEAVVAEPDLIVLPESFLPAYVLRRSDLLGELSLRARQSGARLLFGTGDFRDDDIQNLVVLLDDTGAIISTYAMVRPVPFGETVPGREIWSALGLGNVMNSFLPIDLTPGSSYEPLGGIGTPICFESTLPAGSRAFVRCGAELLVTVTNDAWFDFASELAAHFASAVFRAVETRRWVVQSANGGISGFVSPRGVIVQTTRDEGVLLGSVATRQDLSLYARWGDVPLLVVAGLVVVGFLVGSSRKRKRERGE